MKKKFLAIAIALLAVGSVSASAKKSDECPQQNCPVTECAQQQCNACDTAACPGTPMMMFFEGIELTPEQQSQLQAIQPQRPDKAPRGERRSRPQGQPRQFAGQGGDSVQTRQAPDQRPDRRQGRRDYINQVKQILTPDQYVVFLENMVTASPAPGQGMRPGKAMKAEKAQKAKDAKAEKMKERKDKMKKEQMSAEQRAQQGQRARAPKTERDRR